MMSYLVVAAHPDDEVLGAGGTIYRLAQAGYEVTVCLMSGQVQARANRPGIEDLYKHINSSTSVLGVKRVISGNFPNLALNMIPHLQLVQFIEQALQESQAEVVITHHPADLNNDHLHTSLACQAAARLSQRRSDILPLKELLFMEVLSSTEWSLNPTLPKFNPNTFLEVGEEGLEKKIVALSMYEGVMRDYPHPRSPEALKSLAIYRGAQAGMHYAEAFESVFRRGF